MHFISVCQRLPKEASWGTGRVWCGWSSFEFFVTGLEGNIFFLACGMIHAFSRLLSMENWPEGCAPNHLSFFPPKRPLSFFLFIKINNGLIQAFLHLSFIFCISYAHKSCFYFCQWGKRGSILSNILTQSIFPITKLLNFASLSPKILTLQERFILYLQCHLWVAR